MVKPLLLLPAVFFIGYAAPVPAAPGQAANAAKPAAAPQVSAHAKEIYKVDCAICHGANGDGKTDLAHDMGLVMTDFTDPKTLGALSDKDLFDLIRKGKDKMPSEEPARAKDAEVRELILYIRGMSKGPHAPAATPATAPAAPPATAPAATPAAPGAR